MRKDEKDELEAIVQHQGTRIEDLLGEVIYLQKRITAFCKLINYLDGYKCVSPYHEQPLFDEWECLPVVDCDLKFFKKKRRPMTMPLQLSD